MIHWHDKFKAKNNAGLAYVCLGRSRQFEDIYIKGPLDKKGIHASVEALEETNRLQAKFDEKVTELDEQDKSFWKVSYLNVRSLKGNEENVRKDNLLLVSDLFGLGETWLEPGEEKFFTDFKGAFSNHGRGKGVAAFYNSASDCIILNSFTSDKFSAIHLSKETFDVVFVYLSAGCKKDEILCQLKQWIVNEKPTTIMGDFNINYKKEDKFIKSLEKMGFSQLIEESTCDTGSIIDHIYINDAMKLLDINIQKDSAYYSDHDIITINIPK